MATPSIPPTDDISHLIPVKHVNTVDWQDDTDGDVLWQVDVVADHDNYHVGFALRGSVGLRVTLDDARRIAYALMLAASTAEAKNDFAGWVN